MREIKFRAWDTKKGHFDYEPLICRGKCCYIDSFDNFEEYEQGRMELQQYIGLKDKNGKEIYEGDIDGSDEPMYVAFENGSFGLKFKDKPNYLDNCINWDMCEIIGNIYEQPNLLEETQNGSRHP